VVSFFYETTIDQYAQLVMSLCLALELAALCNGVKSIFVSGYPENSITRRGLRQPGWLYLPKPFSVAVLMQKIKEALPDENLPS
jgi:two-component SAPR family response regulator